MALAYRTGSFVSAGNASGGNLTLTKPTGTVDGDRVVVVVYFESDTCVITVSNGPWETVLRANTGAFNFGVYTKIASSEPASYTISNDTAGSQWRAGAGAAYSGGTGSGTLIDISGGNQGDSTLETAATAPTVTTTGTNRMLVQAGGNFNGSSFTSADGAASNFRGQLGGAVGIADALIAAAGATGTSRLRGQGTTDFSAIHVAIISDIAGGTTHNGGASLGAVGGLLAGAQRAAQGIAGLGAAGGLLIGAQRAAEGGAGQGAVGGLLVAGQRVAQGMLQVGGVGGLGIFGERVALGAAELGGAGWLSASGQRLVEGASGQGGAGWLTAETLKILIGGAGLEAIGRMLGDGSGAASGTTHQGGADLGGVGGLSVYAERVVEGGTGQAAAGWMTAFAERVAQGAAELAGHGDLTAGAQRVALGAIELPGAGWVNITATVTHRPGAAFGGAGYLSADVLVQSITHGAGARPPYRPHTRAGYLPEQRAGVSPHDRNAYQPELRAGRTTKSRRVY